MYPTRSISVSSVASFNPTFCIRLSLSSSRTLMLSSAPSGEKTFRGDSAASPYALFLRSSSSSTSLHTDRMLASVLIQR